MVHDNMVSKEKKCWSSFDKLKQKENKYRICNIELLWHYIQSAFLQVSTVLAGCRINITINIRVFAVLSSWPQLVQCPCPLFLCMWEPLHTHHAQSLPPPPCANPPFSVGICATESSEISSPVAQPGAICIIPHSAWQGPQQPPPHKDPSPSPQQLLDGQGSPAFLSPPLRDRGRSQTYWYQPPQTCAPGFKSTHHWNSFFWWQTSATPTSIKLKLYYPIG